MNLRLEDAWLKRSLQKVDQLAFLMEELSSTVGQIAIKFALSGSQVATVLPNITNPEQLREFTAAPETEEIADDLLQRVIELYDADFYLEPEPSEEAATSG